MCYHIIITIMGIGSYHSSQRKLHSNHEEFSSPDIKFLYNTLIVVQDHHPPHVFYERCLNFSTDQTCMMVNGYQW